MVAKPELLKDVREHPHTTGGEAAARLDTSEGAVLEAYRRARRQGLLEGDGTRPEKFRLTDAGLRQLRVLSGEDNPSPVVPSGIEEKLSELEERVADTVEDVKGLFGLVDRVLQARRTSRSESSDSASGLLEENGRLREELSKQSKVVEFYGTWIALVQFDGRREILEARHEKLKKESDPETVRDVRQLIELEEKLGKELTRFWGPSEDAVRKLQGEIAAMREKLGFAAGIPEEEREEQSEEEE